MASQAEILLPAKEIKLYDRVDSILLGVESTLCQRLKERLVPRHRRDLRTEGSEGLDDDWVLLCAELEPLQVLRGADRALAVRQVAQTVLIPGEGDQPVRREPGQHVLAYRPVEHGPGVGGVAEQERNVEDLCFRNVVADRGARGHDQIEGAALRTLDQRPFAARRALLAQRGLEHLEAADRLDPVPALGASRHLQVEYRPYDIVSDRVQPQRRALLGRRGAGEGSCGAGEEGAPGRGRRHGRLPEIVSPARMSPVANGSNRPPRFRRASPLPRTVSRHMLAAEADQGGAAPCGSRPSFSPPRSCWRRSAFGPPTSSSGGTKPTTPARTRRSPSSSRRSRPRPASRWNSSAKKEAWCP